MVLSYSGLGFGGSGCKITLDDRDYDGKAASQLVTFLGGGKAAKDGTRVDYVNHDATAHDGKHHANDPRVGMIGGSYGGQIQFAVAGIDPRVDTIIPIITWNDLAYSLAPNNTVVRPRRHLPDARHREVPVDVAVLRPRDRGRHHGRGADPARNVGCPNFDDRACGSKAQMDATGAPNDATLLFARHASVESFIKKIRIPTLLAQGQADTLFNLQESVATYRSLLAQRVPVKMIWQSWGHSTDHPAPGEMDHNQSGDLKNPAKNYETRTFLQWFDYYLAGKGPRPSLDFSYFRDWVKYTGDATKAYAEAPKYPVGKPRKLYLSGSSALVRDRTKVSDGTSTFTTPTLGAPASFTEVSALDQSQPVTDAPGTFAQFSTPPLASNTDVIGVPTADLSISAPTFDAAASTGGAPAELVLFFKLYDIKPDGTVVLSHRVISPVRIADTTLPVHVELAGIVHRFPKGDRLALTIAASDSAYRGNNTTGTITIDTLKANPGRLTIPVVATSAQKAIGTSSPGSGKGHGGSDGEASDSP